VYPSFHAYPQRNCKVILVERGKEVNTVNPVLSAFLHLVIDPRNANVRRIARPFPSDPFPAEVKWQNLVMRRSDFRIVRFMLGSRKLPAGSEKRSRCLSFPCLGLDRSGATGRRVTLPLPAGHLFYRLSSRNLKHLADRYSPLMNVWSLRDRRRHWLQCLDKITRDRVVGR
jgi:hypothetical protein